MPAPAYTELETVAAIEGDKKANPRNYPNGDKAAKDRRQMMLKRLAVRTK